MIHSINHLSTHQQPQSICSVGNTVSHLHSEQNQEGHHEGEESSGFGESETQNGVGEELTTHGWVAGDTGDEGAEHRSDTSSCTLGGS